MPHKPPRVCNKCRNTVPAGQRCPCTPPWQGSAWGGGSTRQWRNLRESKLRDQPICETQGCSALATEVDHITPLAHGGQRYDWTNLQSLCVPHHDAKTLHDARNGRNRRKMLRPGGIGVQASDLGL
ncbi:HNH endonuclease signature motif containing protein [Nocardia rhamnosiphila]|uniref:HNH endonuclease n=1 Tax=Nocardia rhamnosiphila TaxID=426716 RepID=UPI003402EEDA